MTHPEDTATIERDLSAVEAALADGAVTDQNPGARELQELALALRADAPVPEPEFGQELQQRVSLGFPSDFRSQGRNPRLPRIKVGPVVAVVAPLMLVVAVIFAAGGPLALNGGEEDAQPLALDGGDDTGGGGAAESGGGAEGGGGRDAPGSGAVQSGSADRAVAPPPALQAGAGFAPNRRLRRIERSISMTLAAPDEEIPEVADGVNRVAARNGGFVLRSELDTSDDGSSGSFELRIPADRLQPALRGLAGLATVSSQSQSGRDVTRGFVTAADRLQSARAERRSLLRRLEQALTDSEAEALRVRLDLVAAEINGLRGRLRALRLRTDYATVSVDLVGGEHDSGSIDGGGSFDDAVGDAGDLLVGFAGVLIRVLAIALPLGLIALVCWAAAAALRRRRRESALA